MTVTPAGTLKEGTGVAVLNSDQLLTSPIDFFSALPLLLPQPQTSSSQKCRLKICLTVPLALISVPHTREHGLQFVIGFS